ncbi:MAG: PDZ domain-containing protein [Myxococcota bacterium]
MPRRIWIVAGVALALVLLLRTAVWLDEGGPSRTRRTRAPVPEVIAGRDLAADAPQRADADFDMGTLVCSWDGQGEAGSVTAFSAGEVRTASGDRDIRLQLEPGEWTVTWTPPDGSTVQLGTVEVEAGRVQSCRLARSFHVRGHVVNLDGKPLAGVLVRGCGARVTTDDGGAFEMRAQNGACSVQATWQDGLLSRRSSPTQIGAFGDEDVEIELDDRPIAGIGIAFDPSMEGSRVQRVHEGTPAEEAGLREGDLIVAIDGQKVGGIEEDEFIRLATGEEGTVVDLTVEREGGREHVRVRRERLERVDTGL